MPKRWMTLAWSIRRGQSVATTPADSEIADEGDIVSDTGTEVEKELSFRSEVIKFNQRRRDETLRPTAGINSEDAMASKNAKNTKPTKEKKTKTRVKAKSALSKATRGTFGEGKTHAALSKVTGGTFGEGKTRAKVKGAVSKATGGTFMGRTGRKDGKGRTGRKTKKEGSSKARSGSRSDDSSTGSDEGGAKGDDGDAAASQVPTTEEKEAPGDELAIENAVTRLLSGRRHVTRQQLWEAARFKTGAAWGAAGASVLFRTRSEFDAALDMMEDMGLFVSHGNDTLYVQPSWLVDVMRRVVCHNPLPVEVEVEVQKTQQTPEEERRGGHILYVARLRINAPVGDRGGGRREIVLPARTAEEIIPLRPKLESFLLSTVPDDIDSASTPSNTTSTADRTLSVVRKIVATFPRLLADQRGGVPSLDPSYVAAQYKTHLDRYMNVCNRWDEFDDDATGMLGTQARAALVDALCMKSRTNTGLTKHWELRHAGSGVLRVALNQTVERLENPQEKSLFKWQLSVAAVRAARDAATRDVVDGSDACGDDPIRSVTFDLVRKRCLCRACHAWVFLCLVPSVYFSRSILLTILLITPHALPHSLAYLYYHSLLIHPTHFLLNPHPPSPPPTPAPHVPACQRHVRRARRPRRRGGGEALQHHARRVGYVCGGRHAPPGQRRDEALHPQPRLCPRRRLRALRDRPGQSEAAGRGGGTRPGPARAAASQSWRQR